MHKRKLDINALKRSVLKGKKNRTINVNYQTVLAYFKQKQVNAKEIFQVNFPPLLQDLLTHFNNLEIVHRIQNDSKDSIKQLNLSQDYFKLDCFTFKTISTQFPIRQLSECLYVQRQQKNKKVLGIIQNKLMIFFKNLRKIYSEFCYCEGEKYIIQNTQLKSFYELFENEWAKNQQKKKSSNVQKLQKKLCRSLYCFGVLIENNIFSAIQERQRKNIQQSSEVGTKSQKNINIKYQNFPISTTYSIDSTSLLSNMSNTIKSLKSNEEDNIIRNDYSQKSEKITRKARFYLFNKAEIKNLSLRIYSTYKNQSLASEPQDQINLLYNDVQNIYIEQAFKLQKWKDFCQRSEYHSNPYYYYSCIPTYQYQFYEVRPPNDYNIGQMQQIKRSVDNYNLVETRKNSKNKLLNKKYN